MAPDRRYDEREAEEIFAIAARSDPDAPVAGSKEGAFSLPELQEIGKEAGIHPDRIAEAAAALAARGTPLPHETSLGMRASVGRVVPLTRRPTEGEWDALVTELRDVFGAVGEVREQGGAREWSNGALRVLLEPTTAGHQLRLTTVNRRLRRLNRVAVTLVAWGLVFLVLLLPGLVEEGGTLPELLLALLPSLLVAAGGLGFIAYSGLSLPKWIGERSEQFERIADRARGLVAGESDTEPEVRTQVDG